MNKYRIVGLILFVFLAAGTGMAQISESQKVIGNMNIKAIKKVQVSATSTQYMLHITPRLANENDDDLRITNGEFDVIFERAGGRPLLLGRTKLADLIVPANSYKEPELIVPMGSTSSAALAKIFEAVNIIGDPDSMPKITLRGTSEVGLKVKNGWVWIFDGQKIRLELEYTPQFQREVLLQ